MENEWDLAAREYSQKIISESGDLQRQAVITPNILRVVSEFLQGSKVLDLGCGEGFIARLLKDSNFNITGVDFSKELLKIAKERSTPGSLIQADLNKPINIGNDFDLVIANMVFMDMKNLNSGYQNAYDALKNEGSLLVFILHPAFAIPTGKWAKTITGKIFRHDPFIRIDKYFDLGKIKIKMRDLNKQTTVWHRPIMEYIEIPLSMGFELTEFKEFAPTPTDLEKLNEPIFISKIPQILMLRFIKHGED